MSKTLNKTSLNNGLVEELKQCYESTKNWKLQKYNQQYYRGVHDAYIHLIRFTEHSKGLGGTK